ncbi:hypothetical protein EKO27_g145 [Xylaria grammica]|uniref:Heterokaryon incompatibility domain-containing protein n=1 Tax=Xylaria grammica TaxID=363999 RepID=A0A439DKF5_9PEZI|nr:hypothetical protein EKO27_g145 [Xylaria grammica]
MPTFNKFHYEPLGAEDAVRFILLDPATCEEDPLSCSIIQYQRSEQIVDYSAVSYAWGDPEFSRNLEVKYDGDTSYLRITHNVDTLLRRLRAFSESHYLWIDAICLNQMDEDEKAQQVPLMGRIFGEAKMVHIWLGPEDDMTAKVFAFLKLASLVPEAKPQSKMARLVVDVMIKIFGSSRGFCELMDFSERPWFSRRWIIQEACLAQRATVHCGGYSIPLPLLAIAAKRIQTLDISSYQIKVMANLGRPMAKLTMLELLWNFHEARCLEPKDRIAALLGLVTDDHRLRLDYTAQWAELYKKTVSNIFRLGDNDTRLQVLLHLFEFGPVSLPEDIAYPSWVPDWSNSRQRRLPYHSHIRNPDTYEPYPTSLGHSAKIDLTFCHNTLQIHWRASTSGPRGRRVVWATRFGSPLQTQGRSTEQVINVLDRLFPPTSDSTLRVLAVSSLLKMIVEFRHSRRDQEFNNPALDMYIRSIISQRLPKLSNTSIFKSLRTLGSLLQEFCLFELESSEPGSETSTDYGISSQQLQVGDVMIPLWNGERMADTLYSDSNMLKKKQNRHTNNHHACGKAC